LSTLYTCHWTGLCNFPSILCNSVPAHSCSRRAAEFTVRAIFHPRGIPLELEKLFTVWGLPRHAGTRISKSSPELLFQSFQFYKGQKKTLHIARAGLLATLQGRTYFIQEWQLSPKHHFSESAGFFCSAACQIPASAPSHGHQRRHSREMTKHKCCFLYKTNLDITWLRKPCTS